MLAYQAIATDFKFSPAASNSIVPVRRRSKSRMCGSAAAGAAVQSGIGCGRCDRVASRIGAENHPLGLILGANRAAFLVLAGPVLTTWAWFSAFFEKAWVSRVKRHPDGQVRPLRVAGRDQVGARASDLVVGSYCDPLPVCRLCLPLVSSHRRRHPRRRRRHSQSTWGAGSTWIVGRTLIASPSTAGSFSLLQAHFLLLLQFPQLLTCYQSTC